MSTNATVTTPSTPSSSFMKRVTRLVGPIGRAMAGHRWFKLYGLLVYRGRTSGREYRLPIVARPFEDGFVIPMPFGDATQWAKNVVAAGGAQLVWNGRTYHLTSPELIDAEVASPSLTRLQQVSVGRLGMTKFMRLRVIA